MAGLKEIKRRMGSVVKTRKITYAMKLVSAAKLKKAQDAVNRSREYTRALNELLGQLVLEQGEEDLAHPLMQSRAQRKRVRLIVAGGNRGLCGGFNASLARKIDSFIEELQQQENPPEIESVILGKKPAEYYRRVKREYLESHEALPEDASLWPIADYCQALAQAFLGETVDEVYLIYVRFKSALTVIPTVEKLLPMDADSIRAIAEAAAERAEAKGKMIFEPSGEEVFQVLVPRILRARVLQACLDTKASEHGARMTAMEAGTKNAGELLDRLRLKYNKLRQEGITNELLDIVGGAEALNEE